MEDPVRPLAFDPAERTLVGHTRNSEGGAVRAGGSPRGGDVEASLLKKWLIYRSLSNRIDPAVPAADTSGTLGSVWVRFRFRAVTTRRQVASETEREIYPNAPLQFVAFELRTPYTPAFASFDGTSRVYAALQDVVPIIHPPAMPANIELSGASGVTFSSGPTRMIDRTRTTSVIVGPTQVVVETSTYVHFEAFEELVNRVLETVGDIGKIAGIQRVGLRYIDEIRVDGVETPRDWEPYIAPSLLSGIHLDDRYVPASSQGIIEFDVGDGQRTVMRFGAMRGFVVDPNGPLRLRRSSDAAFFMLDLDSYWAAATDADTPEYSPGAVREISLRLREPVRALFEAAITDRLRNDVLRKEVTSNG